MFIAIESDESNTEMMKAVAAAFIRRYISTTDENKGHELEVSPLEVIDFLKEPHVDTNLPLSYMEANRYQFQNRRNLKNCIVLNYYLVNNEYWPRFLTPDYVFVIGETPFTSRRFKEIHKVANIFNKTSVTYVNTKREGLTSQKELLRILSMEMFIATIDHVHVFREDLEASENV